jgi:putative ABC transport system ATP-binding protein
MTAPDPGPDAPIVACRSLTKTYRQGQIEVPALRGIDLDIGRGDFASLAGPSGSGKTTFLNIIGGLDRADRGPVVIDGEDITPLGNDALADLRLRKIGFVFQSYNLVPVLSAVENVEFILQLMGVSAPQRRERAMAMLAQVGLGGLEHRRPARLSGGQQQRVAVARALVSRPAIVLADEPTANLDTHAASDLIDLMADLNQRLGTTFLMTTHDPRVIARTRRHIVLTDGRISSDEPNRERAA